MSDNKYNYEQDQAAIWRLPTEIWVCEISAYLDDRDRHALNLVNKRLNRQMSAEIYRRNARYDGSSALLWAAREGSTSTARLALDYGADPNRCRRYERRLTIPDGVSDNIIRIIRGLPGSWTSPLHAAAEHGHQEIVELLLQKGADIDGARSDCICTMRCVYEGRTAGRCPHRCPLDCAVAKGTEGSLAVARYLILRGAALRWDYHEGSTALHEAASSGARSIVELLASRPGFDVDQRNGLGRGALHTLGRAGRRETAEMVGCLLALGSDVEATDTRGATPLMVACGWWLGHVAEALLAAGANPHAEDRLGNTALFHATAWTGHLHAVRSNDVHPIKREPSSFADVVGRLLRVGARIDYPAGTLTSPAPARRYTPTTAMPLESIARRQPWRPRLRGGYPDPVPLPEHQCSPWVKALQDTYAGYGTAARLLDLAVGGESLSWESVRPVLRQSVTSIPHSMIKPLLRFARRALSATEFVAELTAYRRAEYATLPDAGCTRALREYYGWMASELLEFVTSRRKRRFLRNLRRNRPAACRLHAERRLDPKFYELPELGTTLLHLAAMQCGQGSLVVSHLLDLGADADALDEWGHLPLEYAVVAFGGKARSQEMLLEAMSEPVDPQAYDMVIGAIAGTYFRGPADLRDRITNKTVGRPRRTQTAAGEGGP